MLLKYWEKYRLTQLNKQPQLASMGISESPATEVIEQVLAETGEASSLFTSLAGPRRARLAGGLPRYRPRRDFIRGEYAMGPMG